MSTTITARARFFAGQPIQTRNVVVDCDGTIRVWDEVAGYYTTCHSLTKSAKSRIRKLAARAAEAGAAHTDD